MEIDKFEIEEQQLREQISQLFNSICTKIGKERAMGLFAEITESCCVEQDTDECIKVGFRMGYEMGFQDGYIC